VEESVRPEPTPPRPTAEADDDSAPAPVPDGLDDPRALAILSTEHWGLLTARSLVYNEAFSRGSMFLTFVSASLVALGFVSAGSADSPSLALVAIPILLLDLFVGMTTLGRLVGAGAEEIRALQGMARLRHAYLEMAPGIEPYLSTPWHDDVRSVLGAYGPTAESPRRAESALHGLTTMPALVSVINCAVAGALVATVAATAGLSPLVALAAGVVAAVLLAVAFMRLSLIYFANQGPRMEVRFPAGASGPPRAGTTGAGAGPAAGRVPPDAQPGRRNT